MTTKLKIDLSQGLLEVEGSEAFVRTIYSDFKTHFAGIDEDEGGTGSTSQKTRRTRKTKASKGKTTTSSKASSPQQTISEKQSIEAEIPTKLAPLSPTYTYLNDLELGATKDHPSLIEFMDAKFPITNEERNIVFIYFLQNMLNLDSVTPNHIYTCYRAVKFRAPLNIENTLTRRDWIEVDKDGGLTLTAVGKTYVEKQLPKKVKN